MLRATTSWQAKWKGGTSIMAELFIYFNDLSEQAQQDILDFYGIETPEQANLDTMPLATLYQE